MAAVSSKRVAMPRHWSKRPRAAGRAPCRAAGKGARHEPLPRKASARPEPSAEPRRDGFSAHCCCPCAPEHSTATRIRAETTPGTMIHAGRPPSAAPPQTPTSTADTVSDIWTAATPSPRKRREGNSQASAVQSREIRTHNGSSSNTGFPSITEPTGPSAGLRASGKWRVRFRKPTIPAALRAVYGRGTRPRESAARPHGATTAPASRARSKLGADKVSGPVKTETDDASAPARNSVGPDRARWPLSLLESAPRPGQRRSRAGAGSFGPPRKVKVAPRTYRETRGHRCFVLSGTRTHDRTATPAHPHPDGAPCARVWVMTSQGPWLATSCVVASAARTTRATSRSTRDGIGTPSARHLGPDPQRVGGGAGGVPGRLRAATPPLRGSGRVAPLAAVS
ncbi:hypothetical protein HNQ79_006373 [Streptomyces candidus]|uniref:Uncharacterized protein n=1 Tax=Streptomyces candidus TaxID=67283 RepID=A0A7X0LU94_9ACTN|nr:hypothetical protein [Streptomyces candidus]